MTGIVLGHRFGQLADVVVGGEVFEIRPVQGVQPAEASAKVPFPEPIQRAIRGITLFHGTGIDDFQQPGSQFLGR